MISEKDYNGIYLKGYEDGKNDNNNLEIHYEIKPSFTTRKIKELQQENQKYKEVIDKTKMRISAIIKKYQQKIDNEIDMGSQGDHFKICRYEENIKILKDILKEMKTC